MTAAAERAIAEARALMASKRASLCSHGVDRDHCKGHDLERPAASTTRTPTPPEGDTP